MSHLPAFLPPFAGVSGRVPRGRGRLACRRVHALPALRARSAVTARLQPDDGSCLPDVLPDGLSYDSTYALKGAIPGRSAPELENDFAGGAGGVADIPGGGGSGDGDDSVESVVRSAGRALEDIPKEIRALSAAQVASYLDATSSGISRFLGRSWGGWARRCAADAEFPFKVLMELTVGLGLAASGMIAARGKDILKELDFAICDIAVGGTLNFILVYLLTPIASATASTSVFAKLPANVFIAGQYSLLTRMAAFLYKGALFAVAGFAGSLVGTAASQGLIGIRRAVAPSSAPEKPLPNVVVNSAAWAGFMLFSANPRYQAVAGAERALFTFAPDALAKAASAALRTGNNVAGGAIWVWWARYLGLQPAPVDPAISVPGEAPVA